MKSSLLVDLSTVTKEHVAKYGVAEGSKLLTYSFVLASVEEVTALRNELALKQKDSQGRRMKLYKGLPVPDVD